MKVGEGRFVVVAGMMPAVAAAQQTALHINRMGAEIAPASG